MNAMSTEKRKYELRARAERQEETRRRIVEATVALHEEVGPARTTVAEIARRAGVQRLTVYNHFPDDGELFAACSGQWLEAHPPPPLEDVFAIEDPARRIAVALERFYSRWEETEPMTYNVLRDRSLLPALDERVRLTIDAGLDGLATELGGGFAVRGRRAERLRALIRVALDFWTWRLLRAQGLENEAAARLMADVVACEARREPRRS
jgi:AcrR family transcriptional regulator